MAERNKKEVTFTATQIKTETKKVFDAVDLSDYVLVTNFNEPKYVIIRYEKFKQKAEGQVKDKKRPDIRLMSGPVGDPNKKVDMTKYIRRRRDADR